MISAQEAHLLSFSVILTENMLSSGETKIPLDIICEKIKILIFKVINSSKNTTTVRYLWNERLTTSSPGVLFWCQLVSFPVGNLPPALSTEHAAVHFNQVRPLNASGFKEVFPSSQKFTRERKTHFTLYGNGRAGRLFFQRRWWISAQRV